MDFEIRKKGYEKWQDWGNCSDEDEALEQFAAEYDDEGNLTTGSVLLVEIRQKGVEQFKTFKLYAEVDVSYISREV